MNDNILSDLFQDFVVVSMESDSVLQKRFSLGTSSPLPLPSLQIPSSLPLPSLPLTPVSSPSVFSPSLPLPSLPPTPGNSPSGKKRS